MSKLIEINENGVIYIQNAIGEVFGIVSVSVIIDIFGQPCQSLALDVLENNGFDLEYDSENNTTSIRLVDDLCEIHHIVFDVDDVCVESD